MSREIKFRRWHKVLHDMIYSDLHISDFFQVIQSYPEMYHLMQYTNLKDKNGKDIYEGDVLERKGLRDIFRGSADDVLGAVTLTRSREVVKLDIKYDGFGNTSFGYSLHHQCTYSERSNPATYEVIGNIYENPELINEPTT